MSDRVQAYYDFIAREYGQTFFHELENKPFDRSILSRFAALTKGQGLVSDIGCGSGHIGYFLQQQGLMVQGIDLSAEMVQEARRRCPEIEFRQGDMMNLDYNDNYLAGIVAFYAIVHLSLSEVDQALREFKRVIRPGGYLLFSFHIGGQVIRVEKSQNERKAVVDFIFFDHDEIINKAEANGWIIEEAIIRYPYRDIEYPSKRAYILARKDQTVIGP